MEITPAATRLLVEEARALLTRLDRVKPFVLYETMVPAAAPSPLAMDAIERYLASGRRSLRRMMQDYIRWLEGPAGSSSSPDEMQRIFSLLKMQFNNVLSQFDIFADVMTQRSENETGIWLSGLDVAAADALNLPGGYYQQPSVICYLDRGHGAAIRRARTRLPGGGENPVAIIRVPRERMVGSGIASSLIHEVGHQGSALLGLANSMRPLLHGMQQGSADKRLVWGLWERWISEILSDFWSVAHIGVAGTLGLMGVVSLPRAFIFRVSLDDPHPIPWVRVRLSCALGAELYPDPQWTQLSSIWHSYYPLEGLDPDRQRLLMELEASMLSFISLLVHHRPRSLRGKSLKEVLATPERQPRRLRGLLQTWRAAPNLIPNAAPCLAFAVLGQARSDGRLDPQEESLLLANLLTTWAMRSSLDTARLCAQHSQARGIALAT